MPEISDGASLSNDPSISAVLSGEIDLSNANEVKTVLIQVIDNSEHPQVVVSASQVTFIDSLGLGAVVSAFNHAKAKSIEFVLHSPSVRMRQLLEITGLIDTIPVIDA